MSAGQAYAQTEHTIEAQAYLLSMNEVFTICGLTMVALLFVIWWARPPFGPRLARPSRPSDQAAAIRP